ncbi:putative B3 domain-containing protein [Nymphaea thermarum]|nr:putative B3 domain-containing protein [Nymphaea thermarum]
METLLSYYIWPCFSLHKFGCVTSRAAFFSDFSSSSFPPSARHEPRPEARPSSSRAMASHLHASHRQPTNDQFEIMVNEIPMEQPAANTGFPAGPTMNITRSMRVHTQDTIDVERVICVNQRYLVPVDLPQMTVQLPYGDTHPFRSAYGNNEQVPLNAANGDLGMQNVFNYQNQPQSCCDTTNFRAPAAETLTRAIEIENSSRGLGSYQQYAGCPLAPVSIQPISAPNYKHLEHKEFSPNHTENSFPKINGEIISSRNEDFNGCNGLEAMNGPMDLSGVISRNNFNLNIKIPGSDSPLQLSNSSPMQHIEQRTDEVGREDKVRNDGNGLVLVLKKELSNSDVANLGRIILPKREAETHFPQLEDKMALTIEMEDLQSDIIWAFKFRLQVGDTFMIFKDKDGKYMVSHEKNESSRTPGGRLKHGKRRTVTPNVFQPFQGESRPLSNPTQTGAQQIIETQMAFPPFFSASPFVRPEDLNRLMH